MKQPDNSIFSSIEEEIKKGLQGSNEGIPIGFPRLEQYASLRKKQYYLIGGYTGSAKSTFIQDAFILNPKDISSLYGKKQDFYVCKMDE